MPVGMIGISSVPFWGMIGIGALGMPFWEMIGSLGITTAPCVEMMRIPGSIRIPSVPVLEMIGIPRCHKDP